MSEEFQPAEMPERPPRREHRHRPSLFWPVALIALGGYFLLVNLGYMQPTGWAVLVRLWPVLLIVMGLDVLVRQMPGLLGSALSLLLALGLIGAVAYVAINPEQFPALTQGAEMPTPTTQHVSAQRGDATQASVALELESYSTRIDSDIAEDMLIVADVTTTGHANLEQQREDDTLHVSLFTDKDETAWIYWLNPATWGRAEGQEWRIHLSPMLDTGLEIGGGSGSLEADLSDLRLTGLNVDGGSGSLHLTLPDRGGYDVELSGGSGSMALKIPPGVEARVELDSGSGSFNPDGRFKLVEGERDGDGLWETEGYSRGAADSITIFLDQGSGSVSIREP
jgi:hypothetical protein